MADKKDPPALNVVYPDAAAIFAFKPAPVATVLSNGLIVLDTNTLLTPYGTGRATLEEIKKTYLKLIGEKRLVVPGQAAREFAKHRPEKLTNLYKDIGQRRQMLSASAEYHLLAELKEYQDWRESERNVDKALEARAKATRALLAKVDAWLWDDPISELYRQLFTRDVVVDPPIEDGFEADLQRRATHKIPPGYKDAGKEEGGPGDLLIWKTILYVGRTLKKHVMFVTGEEKSDWWHRSADGPLYPRYELLEEFRRESDGNTFHIMNFAELLKESGAGTAVVEEVRREQIAVTDHVKAVLLSPRRTASEAAVARWLSETYSSVAATGGFPDLWAESDVFRIAVEVKLIGVKRKLVPKLDQAIAASEKIRQKGRVMVVFVAQERGEAVLAGNVLREHIRGLGVAPERLEIVIGFLKGQSFNEVSRI